MNTLVNGSYEMIGPAVTRRTMVRRVLLACGIASSLIWLGTDLIASLLSEGYSYPFQPISGLTATGAPSRPFVVALDYVYSVLKIAFAAGIWMFAGQKRSLRITAVLLFVWGIIDLVASFFPLNPAEALVSFANIMHAILAGGAAVILMMLAMGFGASTDGTWFRWYSYGTLLVMIIAGLVMAFVNSTPVEANLPPAWFGITERINTYGYMIWMLVLAIVLLRAQPDNLGFEDKLESTK